MRVSFSTISFLGKVNKTQNNLNFGAKLNNAPVSDIFVKSTEKPSLINFEDENYLNALYDEVYDDVIKQNVEINPVIGELNLQKPTLVIGDMEDDCEEASYIFPSNTIILQEKVLKKDVAAIYYEAEGEKYILQMTTTDKLNNLMNEYKEKYPEMKLSPVILNDKEKEMLIKNSFAHEIRHFIQWHLVASTEGCEDVINEYRERAVELRKLFTEIEELGKNVSEKDKLACNSDYIDNYKPKKVLPEDTKIKFSVLEDDTRQISVKDGFRAGFLMQGPSDNDEDKELQYLSLTDEIDAFNYEAEYMQTHLQNAKKGARKGLLQDIVLYEILTSMDGIDYAEALGIKVFAD